MALIARVRTDDSIRGFRRAATARYGEALQLAVAGERLGSVYLFGYVAEVLLKAAFFRLEGYGPDDRLPLNHARTRAHSWGLPRPRNLHDIPWWTTLLVEARKVAGRPYGAAFSASLLAYTNQLYSNWREFLRYRTNRPSLAEVAQVRDSATWLIGQYRYFY